MAEDETKPAPKRKPKATHEVRADGSIAFYAEKADADVVREVAASREKGTS